MGHSQRSWSQTRQPGFGFKEKLPRPLFGGVHILKLVLGESTVTEKLSRRTFPSWFGSWVTEAPLFRLWGISWSRARGSNVCCSMAVKAALQSLHMMQTPPAWTSTGSHAAGFCRIRDGFFLNLVLFYLTWTQHHRGLGCPAPLKRVWICDIISLRSISPSPAALSDRCFQPSPQALSFKHRAWSRGGPGAQGCAGCCAGSSLWVSCGGVCSWRNNVGPHGSACSGGGVCFSSGWFFPKTTSSGG